MLDYPALAALSEIIRRGSFEAAAAALHVSPSAISQRIRGLEDRMGAVLIHRGPPVRGTAEGLRLMRHLDQVRLLEQGLGGSAPAHLRLAINADSLATWVLPALSGEEGVLFDLVVDDQDHAQDWLKRGEVSAAMTAALPPVPGCDAIRLGAMRYLPTAAPGFAARWFPEGVTADALTAAPALIFNAKDRLQGDWAAARAGRPVAFNGHFIPSSEAFAEAARLGLGWGMNPESLVAGDVAAGRLVTLGPPLDVALDWQVQRLMVPRLRALTAQLRAAAARALHP